MDARPLVLALLVLLAGCSGGGFTVDETTSPPAPDRAGMATTQDAAGGLWPDEPIVVGINASANESRNWRPLVREALTYWEANAERYAGYSVDFRLRPDAANPDVELRIVDNVTDCNLREGIAVGCAPYYTSRQQIRRPTVVEVQSGFSNESTVLVMKHELGHVLGLDHGDDPSSVMSHQARLTTLPRPDADERVFPWRDETLSVYVDYRSHPNPELVEAQVRHALDYYDRGADGTVPENVSFTFVSDPGAADVTVTFPDSAPCGEGAGSCGRRYGVDPDDDGAFEYYTELDIAVAGIDAEAVGWHVAYWLGYGFGFSESEDWPEPLRDASYEERRTEWWNAS